MHSPLRAALTALLIAGTVWQSAVAGQKKEPREPAKKEEGSAAKNGRKKPAKERPAAPPAAAAEEKAPGGNAPAPDKSDAVPDNPKPDATSPAGTLLFKDFKDTAELTARLPKELATPRLTAHLAALSSGYREALTGVVPSADGKQLFLLAADGSRHLYDDGRTKSAAQLLEEPDVEDLFVYNYPLTNPTGRLPADFDPGRARPDALFKTLYGRTPAEVQRNIVTVSFAGTKVKFNRLYGAAEALEAAGRELDAVVKTKPELRLWLKNLGGTFNWRKIDGTDRLSTHSFGTAIDLNVEKSKYWRWEKPATLATFSRKDFPAEIIEVFERHGFVWGGKWYHYDTMHFEYRPEILSIARETGGTAAPPPAAAVSDPPHSAAPPAPVSPREAGGKPPAAAAARRALLIDPLAAAGGKPRGSGELKNSLEQCGFTVTLLSGAGLGDSVEALDRLAAGAPAAETLLFHFSGDAIHHNGDTWLLPAGANVAKPDDVNAEALPLKRVVETMGKSAAPTRIVLVDAPPAAPGSGTADEASARQYRTPGFFFGFAGSATATGNRAWQADLFTKALAGRITTPQLSVSDVFTFVTKDVEQQSGGAQKPRSTSTLSEIFRFAKVKPDPVPE